MSGSLPLVVIIVAGIVALCWADLGRKRADASEDQYGFDDDRRTPEEIYREAEGQ